MSYYKNDFEDYAFFAFVSGAVLFFLILVIGAFISSENDSERYERQYQTCIEAGKDWSDDGECVTPSK